MRDKLFILKNKLKSYLTGQVTQEMDSQEPKETLAEVLPTEEEIAISQQAKKKRELIFELSLFFVLGILLGVTIKTEAAKRITIGFNDYMIQNVKNVYNVSDMKNNLEKQAQEQAKVQAQTQSGSEIPSN